MADLPRGSDLPRLYRPDEVAVSLGCSEWWVKDRARRRLIPFTLIGGAYRFTADQFAAAVQLYEVAPRTDVPEPAARPSVKPRIPDEQRKNDRAIRLRARPPRRIRDQGESTAA